jgi:hypothetical protein
MTDEVTFTVRCNFMSRSIFRSELQRLKFDGESIEWEESKVFLGSRFFIKASSNVAMAIKEAIEKTAQ